MEGVFVVKSVDEEGPFVIGFDGPHLESPLDPLFRLGEAENDLVDVVETEEVH